MKITLGIIIGLALSFGTVVFAKVVSVPDVLSIVEEQAFHPGVGTVYKMYDSNNGAVCYIENGGPSNAISCVK